MATKKTISSKFVTVPKKYGGKKSGTHEVELAYITKEEAEHLKKLDLHNSGIDKENHYGPEGIPNFDGGGTGLDDNGDDDNGNGNGNGNEGDAGLQNECEQAGGTWNGSSCVMPDDDDGDDDDDDDEDIDESWEKADPYQTIDEQDKIAKPGSETERVQSKRDIGTPFAESVANTLKGEVAGLGAKSAELASLDINREAQDIQLAAAQKWASKGMSFSTPMLHAEEDMIRDLSRKRLINEDQAIAMQAKLDLGAWNASEPIQKLAAASKLGDVQEQDLFTPGAIDTSEVMDDEFGITLPGFSGLPENISKVFQDYDENPLYPLAENITDPDGNVCNYDELDEDGYCPYEE